jgi:hypothetical protein
MGGINRFNGADKTKRLEQQFSDALGSLISEALETKRGHYGPLTRAEVIIAGSHSPYVGG